MKEFFAVDQFDIKGRGTVYVIDLEQGQKIAVGEEILLDGDRKTIKGVEQAKPVSPFKVRKVGIYIR